MSEQPRFNIQKIWDAMYGSRYPNLDDKIITVGDHLSRLEQNGQLGQVIVDIGSGGINDIHKLLLSSERRLITVDRSGITGVQSVKPLMGSDKDVLHVKYNLDELNDPRKQVTLRRRLREAAKFLDVSCPRDYISPQVDAALFLESLNYLNYKEVIQTLNNYMKIGGRILIYNEIDRGIEPAFSPDRPHSNKEILDFLNSLGYELEKYQEIGPKALGVDDQGKVTSIPIPMENPRIWLSAIKLPTNQ